MLSERPPEPEYKSLDEIPREQIISFYTRPDKVMQVAKEMGLDYSMTEPESYMGGSKKGYISFTGTDKTKEEFLKRLLGERLS